MKCRPLLTVDWRWRNWEAAKEWLTIRQEDRKKADRDWVLFIYLIFNPTYFLSFLCFGSQWNVTHPHYRKREREGQVCSLPVFSVFYLSLFIVHICLKVCVHVHVLSGFGCLLDHHFIVTALFCCPLLQWIWSKTFVMWLGMTLFFLHIPWQHSAKVLLNSPFIEHPREYSELGSLDEDGKMC